MMINEKINLLRQAMRAHGVDAYVIPSSDPHQSEYVAAHWQTREWISGFTGSAGLVIITQQHAGLWTDGRYFLQAEAELAGTEVHLHRQVVQGAPEHITWLRDQLPAGSTVGCDGALFSAGQIRHLEKHLSARQIKVNYTLDLPAIIWKDRPPLPRTTVFEYDIAFTGETRALRLQRIRERMSAEGAAFHLVTTLDDVAWMLNLRGADVAYNPVAIGYLVVGEQMSYLFMHPDKVPDAIKHSLNADGVIVKPYTDITAFLQKLDQPILVDDHSLNMRLYDAIPARWRLLGENIPMLLKAIKNETEIGHLREAMRKDGVALTRFFRWLEQALKAGETVTEYTAGRQLDAFRREQGDYFGESFSAIVGYNANGAIIHYRPEQQHAATIKPAGILLLDSGGQYLQGTTDITRTVALGTPTDEQKLHNTLVLKGHIALAQAKFPEGTAGAQLDMLARAPLWRHGLNYGHGTGHGVGFFLNVHEPPQGFASNPSAQRGSTGHLAGMLSSNEPGFYKIGAYGIRIENLVWCIPAPEPGFLQFETLTLFPIDTQLIDFKILTQEEKSWLQDYHQQVYRALSPLLRADEAAWLQAKCAVGAA
jgi:Xaa-Pro aminopeptidase